VLALDPDNGQLKWYYQEIPTRRLGLTIPVSGESLVLDRDGKKLLVHQTERASSFVYRPRRTAKIENVWPQMNPRLQLGEEHQPEDRRAHWPQPAA